MADLVGPHSPLLPMLPAFQRLTPFFLPTPRWILAAVLAVSAFGPGSGCHLGPTKAPYDAHSRPSAQQLRQHLAPRMQALRINDAKVREGLRPAASLALVAQAPNRLYANVHFSGQEIFTLAFNEVSYGFRSLRVQGLPSGYYSGDTNACVVKRLLGIELAPPSVVALFLGGGPQLDDGWQAIAQVWDGRRDAERLDLQRAASNDTYRLWFRWHSGSWFLVRIEYVHGKGGHARQQWVVEHEDLQLVHGRVMPSKTVIRNALADTSVSLSYRDREAEPRLGLRQLSNEPDDWEDGEAWEDQDGASVQPSASSTSNQPPQPSQNPEASSMPSAFIPRGDGLRARGPLCQP